MRVRFPSPAPLVLTKRVVLNTSQKLILGAAGALFATSAFLAVAQPGDLGGDDDDSAAPAATTTTISESTSTTTGGDTTTTTAPGATTETTEAGTTDTTVAGSTETTVTTVAGSGDTTATTRPSSGIGAGGAGSVGDDIADTGHESMLAGGLALLALGLALRRAAHPRTA